MEPTERLLVAVFLLWSVVTGVVLFLFGRVAVRVISEWRALWRSRPFLSWCRARIFWWLRGKGLSLARAWNLSALRK